MKPKKAPGPRGSGLYLSALYNLSEDVHLAIAEGRYEDARRLSVELTMKLAQASIDARPRSHNKIDPVERIAARMVRILKERDNKNVKVSAWEFAKQLADEGAKEEDVKLASLRIDRHSRSPEIRKEAQMVIRMERKQKRR